MLELACWVSLAMDIAYFLELQRSLKAQGIVGVSADKIYVLSIFQLICKGTQALVCCQLFFYGAVKTEDFLYEFFLCVGALV